MVLFVKVLNRQQITQDSKIISFTGYCARIQVISGIYHLEAPQDNVRLTLSVSENRLAGGRLLLRVQSSGVYYRSDNKL